MRIKKHTKNRKNISNITALFIVLVLAVIGVKLLISGHAQSPYTSVEAEKGTLSGIYANVTTDGTASGGEAVQFGSTTDPSGQPMPGSISGWTQTFADDFTNPNTLTTNYQVQNSSGPAPDGSGSCVASNHILVSGGMLVIKGYQDPTDVSSHGCSDDVNQWVTGGVKVTSNSQTYGKYEVRMRADNGEGVSLVALLWPTSDNWPPEIDFTEDNGVSPRSVDTATEHWGTSSNPQQINDSLNVNLNQWHTVGVEWSPGKIVYTMDGTDWATETNSNVSNVPMQIGVQTQSWQCNSSGTGYETCANSSTPSEVDLDVDWIVIYTAS